MSELQNIENKNIEDMIYVIRGKEVMLDKELAFLYKCVNGTKTINQAVKRNIDRFPNDFYFQLTEEEYKIILRSQIGTLENARGKHSKYLPYAFTEQGVAMLSSVLKTDVASKISVDIMRAFVLMRHLVNDNKDIYKSLNNINNKLLEHDLLFEKVFSNFQKDSNELLFLNGMVYDAYSKLIDIIYEAKKELIIVDGYADKDVLDIISKVSVKVTLIVKTKTFLKEIDIKKYNEQYHNLEIIYDDSFHDRYIIIDKKKIYHCGASLNKAGSKTFSINKLEDKEVINVLLNKTLDIIRK